jgi:hypothetical protein
MTVWDTWQGPERTRTVVEPKDPYALLRVCNQTKEEAEGIAVSQCDITYYWQDRSSDCTQMLVPFAPKHFYHCLHTLKINGEGRGSMSTPGKLAFLYWIFPNLQVVEYLQETTFLVNARTQRKLALALDEIASNNELESEYDSILMSGLDPRNKRLNTSDVAKFIMSKNLTVKIPSRFDVPGPTPENMYHQPDHGRLATREGGYFIDGVSIYSSLYVSLKVTNVLKELFCDRNGVQLRNITRGIRPLDM